MICLEIYVPTHERIQFSWDYVSIMLLTLRLRLYIIWLFVFNPRFRLWAHYNTWIIKVYGNIFILDLNHLCKQMYSDHPKILYAATWELIIETFIYCCTYTRRYINVATRLSPINNSKFKWSIYWPAHKTWMNLSWDPLEKV